MTLAGKIITVFIFLMSLVLMMTAVCVYSTRTDWRAMIDNPTQDAKHPELGLKQQYERLKKQNEAMKAELDLNASAVRHEVLCRRHAVAALLTKYELSVAQVAAKETEYNDVLAEHAKAVARLKVSQENLEKLQKEVKVLRSEIEAAVVVRDKAFENVVELTEQLWANVGTLKNLTDRRDQLQQQLQELGGSGLAAAAR